VSAVEVLGDKKLKLIAHELLEKLKANVSIDWARKESARARMRLLVKKILKEDEDINMQTLRQAVDNYKQKNTPPEISKKTMLVGIDVCHKGK
jgi:type I restriction enzyme R subunit